MYRVIRANCRTRFEAQDYAFIQQCLNGGSTPSASVFRLVQEADTLDKLLDDAKLFRELLDKAHCVRVSLPFYFYVLVRHVLVHAGLKDREMADYIASLLVEFANTSRMNRPDPESETMNYFHEMMLAMDKLSNEERFVLQAHVGNFALFQSGLFPRHLNYRVEHKAAPSIQFYEDMGRSYFKVASEHKLAHQFALDNIFAEISDNFHQTRMALNDLSSNIVCLESLDAVDEMIRGL